MVGRGPIGKAVGRARRYIKRIKDAQAVLQIADAGRQLSGDGPRQIAPGAPEAVAPRLLAMAEVQTLQGLRLMQPVGGTIHLIIVTTVAGSAAGAADGPDSKPVRVHYAPIVRGKRVCCRSCCRLPPLA